MPPEQNTSPLGLALTNPLCSSFPNGMGMATADGGWLHFRDDEEPEPGEGPPQATVYLLAAVKPLPDRDGEDIDVFTLTTALMDSGGQLWERTRTVTIWEIWRLLLKEPEFHPLFDPPSKNPQFQNAESVIRRSLLDPMDTLCDGRSSNLVEVLRPDTVTRSGQFERWLFRLRFKYFGARIGLTEERASFRNRATNELSHQTELIFTVEMQTSPDSIAVLDQNDKLLAVEAVSLHQLGTLCSRRVLLKAGWDLPAPGLLRRGEIDTWRQALLAAGIEPSKMSALRPQPKVHYLAGPRRA